ncbi:MAG: T9SS type A sorting domain-containing protein [Bacteroidetes bacterium]|nr:T9SS type A sorting domain-containing protein [Bacteroidota bacterium]
MDGECLLTKNYKKKENISFDIRTFANGIYFIEISSADSRMIKKFIKN